MIAALGLHLTPIQLAERITSLSGPDRALIDIRVTGSSPTESARIANAVGRQLVAVSGSLAPDLAATRVNLALVGVARPSS